MKPDETIRFVLTPTINACPRDWCAHCGNSWSLDSIAVTVAGRDVCADCVQAAADVATAERERRNEDTIAVRVTLTGQERF